MNDDTARRCLPSRTVLDAGTDFVPRISRRLVLVGLPLGLAACETPRTEEKLTPEAARLVQWLRVGGRDAVLDPAAPRIMGMDNGQRDIPVKQLAENTANGRLVVSLTSLRGRNELIFHRRQGDYLYFHLATANLVRRASATYPRQGAPSRMTESFAVADYPTQANYWLDQAARRAPA
ncbi:MAG TPA: hypothetical protein VJ890_23805 [Vineibacter sp.]|nr:hypothetical protein [Vineibacter sp.]